MEVTLDYLKGALFFTVVFQVLTFDAVWSALVRTAKGVALANRPVVGGNIVKGGLIFLAVVTTEWSFTTLVTLMLPKTATLDQLPTVMNTPNLNKLTAFEAFLFDRIQIEVLVKSS